MIANRGAKPNLSIESWELFIDLTLKQLGTEVCYGFCLYPYSHVSQKAFFGGFPDRIVDKLKYLSVLELTVVTQDSRERLGAFLDNHGCPHEIISQYNPDAGSDEPIGIRVLGYDFPNSGLNLTPTL